ncbi:MAG: divalent-cation tolerance protein CutA [Nitrosopumilus sp.]|nr:divalent-cation tolerance protein CutA [Nitrosopumilus sp.]
MVDKESDQNGAILISTFSDEKSLIALSKTVIMKKRVCACVSYTAVKSIYMWDSNLQQQENEFLAFFKTTSDCVEKLKAEIKNNHPYDIPEIVVIKMSDVSSEYLNWMYKNTHKETTDV